MIKKYKISLIIMLFLLFVSPITALDPQTINPCGGDLELVIDCLDDQQLFFIGLIQKLEIGAVAFPFIALAIALFAATNELKPKEEKENEQ